MTTENNQEQKDIITEAVDRWSEGINAKFVDVLGKEVIQDCLEKHGEEYGGVVIVKLYDMIQPFKLQGAIITNIRHAYALDDEQKNAYSIACGKSTSRFIDKAVDILDRVYKIGCDIAV